MSRALRAGAAYFAAVFAAGFGLGVARTLWVAPRLGEAAAVAIELPAILAFSWAVCGAATRRFDVPRAPAPRAAMGAFALALLMTAEFALAAALGTPPGAHAAGFATGAGLIGLAGQAAFALLPWLQGRLRRH